jgi:hypothetical protein
MAPTIECRVVRRHSSGWLDAARTSQAPRRDSTILSWPLRRKIGGSFRHFDTQHGLDVSVPDCTDWSINVYGLFLAAPRASRYTRVFIKTWIASSAGDQDRVTAAIDIASPLSKRRFKATPARFGSTFPSVSHRWTVYANVQDRSGAPWKNRTRTASVNPARLRCPKRAHQLHR